MLNIVFGRHNLPKGYVLDTREYFKKEITTEWTAHPFVQEFLKDIDGSDVLGDYVLRNRWGVVIAVEKMSTGCKTLCSILFQDKDRYFYGSAMGDNCVPYLMRIATEYHDVNIFLEHFMMIPEMYFKQGYISVNGKKATYEDYEIASEEYVEEMEKVDDIY